MEPLTQSTTYDVLLVETKKSKEIRIVTSSEIKSVKTITWFETSSEITRNLILAPEILNSKEVPLNALPTQPSYLNLSNTQSLNGVEVVNKFVVDNQITFNRPEQITHVFYDIKFNEDQSIKRVDYCVVRTPLEPFKIETEGELNPQEFVELLEQLNQNSQIVFLLGFGLSSGCFVNQSLKDSLHLIPVWKLFETTLDNFTPVIKYSVETVQTNNGILIQQIITPDIDLRRTYIIDSRQIMFEQLTKGQKARKDKHNLIEYLGLDIEQQSNIQGFENDEIDPFTGNGVKNYLRSFAKAFIIDAQLEHRLQFIPILNLPLSFALYQTPVTCISQQLFRRFRQTGWAFLYKSLGSNSNSEDSKGAIGTNGGIIEPVKIEQRFIPLQYVLEGDFTSEYPSLIIAMNVSPETLITENPDPNAVNTYVHNYHAGQDANKDKVVHFLKPEIKKGIFSQLCEELLTMRKSIDDKHLLNKTLKTILASIYGLLGAEHSSICNPICGRVICSMGRKACDVAKFTLCKTKLLGSDAVVARFTDSCQFLLPSAKKLMKKQFEKIESEWPSINLAIQKIMNMPVLTFKLEPKFAIVKIYLQQSHASIAIVTNRPKSDDKKIPSITGVNPSKLVDGLDDTYTLVCKGMSWNKYNSQIRKMFNQIMAEVCIESAKDPTKDVVEIATKVIEEAVDTINKDIMKIQSFPTEFKSVDKANVTLKMTYDLLMKYSKYQKFSNQDLVSRYLNTVYGIQSECYILPYIPPVMQSLKRRSECWIPTTVLEKVMTKGSKTLAEVESKLVEVRKIIDRIDFPCFKLILDPIKVAFGIKTQLNTSESEQSHTLMKGIELKPGQCQIRKESGNSVKGYKYMQFEIMQIGDLHAMVIKNPSTSFHEITGNGLNRMYFDIESKTHWIKECEIRIQIDKFIKILLPYDPVIPVHIATAHDSKDKPDRKCSYHVTIDIACTKAMNYFIASQMSNFLYGAVDVGVYKPNSSLRLPGCVKIEKNGISENRPFVYSKNECFANFVIQDISNCIVTLNENILFDTATPITIVRDIGSLTSALIEQGLEEIKARTNNNTWKVSQNANKPGIVTFLSSRPYRCFICKNKHDSDGLFGTASNGQIKINCYSNVDRQNNVHMPAMIGQPPVEISDSIDKEEESKDPSIKAKRFAQFKRRIEAIHKDDYIDSMVSKINLKEVKYTLTLPTTYIISGMGTGKSKQLQEILSRPEFSKPTVRIVCLSFRITFTTEFAKKYNLVSYQDIKGAIRLDQTPKVIVQVDSLFRFEFLRTNPPDLLIMDEAESILEKLESSNQMWQNVEIFTDLIKQSQRVVIMDGLMERISIKYLNLIRATDNAEIIFNTHLPRPDYKLQLYQYHSSQFQYVVDLFIDNIKKGKRIYGMITQRTAGDAICQIINQSGLGVKCIYYHGANLKFEGDGGLKSHKDLKDEHFQDVNKYWLDYDIVLHSSTVTAGVSFEKEHFDMQINILSTNTCSAISFVQGCHRVRNLKDKLVITFVEPFNQQGNHRPIDFTNTMYQFHNENDNPNIKIGIHEQVQCWLLLRKCMSHNHIQDLVIKYAKTMGYQIEACMIPEEFIGQKFNPDKDAAARIASVEMPFQFEHVSAMPLDQQHAASLKYKLSFFYDLKAIINTLNEQQIKFLLKKQYIQEYRVEIKGRTNLIKNDDDRTENFWLFQYDWLMHIKYEAQNMQFGIEMQTSQSLLKLQAILKKTRNEQVTIESFEQICQDAKFDRNVLNEINDLRISVKSPKANPVPKLSKSVIAFMQVLSYNVKLIEDRVSFLNVSLPTQLGIPEMELTCPLKQHQTQACLAFNESF